MAKTYHERLCAGLEAMGWRKDLTDKSRYDAFVKPGFSFKLFVGKAGALRKGECASRSYSIGDPSNLTKVYSEVLAKGDAKLNPPLAEYS